MSGRFFGRCTPEQKRQWEKAARLAKRKLSDWIRISLDELSEQQIEDAEETKKRK